MSLLNTERFKRLTTDPTARHRAKDTKRFEKNKI